MNTNTPCSPRSESVNAFDLTHKSNKNILFSCELPEDIADLPRSKKLGWAVLEAMKNNPNLYGADLRGADLRGADLRGADLRDTILHNADLTGADLRGAILPDGAPRIDDIHRTVYAAASKPDALDMSEWHKTDACGTTHCRAEWVIHLAGEAGRALEGVCGTNTTAALIYQATDPTLERIPDFYVDNETALADMQRLAEVEGI